MALSQTGHRRNALWTAAFIHRISGVLLALFLPFHFLVLGLALEGEGALGGFLKWTDSPMVKLAEAGLVFLLAVHLLGGIRVLALENLRWREAYKSAAMIAIAISLGLGAVFLFQVI
ncbi:MAG: succinate dehydrogenase, cytochrome b subunit [Pseudomonadota bacterium]